MGMMHFPPKREGKRRRVVVEGKLEKAMCLAISVVASNVPRQRQGTKQNSQTPTMSKSLRTSRWLSPVPECRETS